VLFYYCDAKNNLTVQKKMMTPLLIDALTISEGRFEKPCPVLVLKMMLLNEEISSEFSEKLKIKHYYCSRHIVSYCVLSLGIYVM
jgi:hypothetical protein